MVPVFVARTVKIPRSRSTSAQRSASASPHPGAEEEEGRLEDGGGLRAPALAERLQSAAGHPADLVDALRVALPLGRLEEPAEHLDGVDDDLGGAVREGLDLVAEEVARVLAEELPDRLPRQAGEHRAEGRPGLVVASRRLAPREGCPKEPGQEPRRELAGPDALRFARRAKAAERRPLVR